jgi:hypothetical protein
MPGSLVNFNLPDTNLDPVGNWGPLSLYPGDRTQRLYKIPFDSGFKVQTEDVAFNRPLGSHHMAYGMDFLVPWGTPVLAAREGRATFQGKCDAWQVIVHSWDTLNNEINLYVDMYFHVNVEEPVISVGGMVKQGQLIVTTGEKGMFDHLHMEVQWDGPGHRGIGIRKGQNVPIPAVPVPFVEITQQADGIPWAKTWYVSENIRVPAAGKSN